MCRQAEAKEAKADNEQTDVHEDYRWGCVMAAIFDSVANLAYVVQ
jgi:hypothetical protein